MYLLLSVPLHATIHKTWTISFAKDLKNTRGLLQQAINSWTLTFTEQDNYERFRNQSFISFSTTSLSSKTFPLEHGGLEQVWPDTIPCSAPYVSAVPTSKSHCNLYCSAFTFWRLLIHLEIANILAAKLRSIWHQLIARLELLQSCYLWRNQELQRVHYAL